MVAEREKNLLPFQRYSRILVDKMAARRQLGFLTSESCAIRSADPENPTIEPNVMSLCCIQPELC